MKVLLLNQFFSPDAAPTGQLLADLAQRLIEDGCTVSVVCGRNSQTRTEMPGVLVVRAPVFPFGRGMVARFLSYGSFLLAALWESLLQQPDLVLTMTTPPLLSLMGTLVSWRRGARHFIWEMDVYPDVAVELGVLRRGAWWTCVLGVVADAARRRADGIIVLGSCMRERLLRHGVPAEKIHLAENWADGESIRPQRRSTANGGLHVLYSGNLGMAHEVETILGVMEALKDDGRFRFTFAGGGSRRAAMEASCRRQDLRHVTFSPYCDRELLSGELAKADLGLVTQRPECLGFTVPSKVYGLMAAARPFLFIGHREATPSQIADRYRCGWQAECGDVQGVVNLLIGLIERPELMEQAGDRGWGAFVREYDRPVGTARISLILGASAPPEKYMTANVSLI